MKPLVNSIGHLNSNTGAFYAIVIGFSWLFMNCISPVLGQNKVTLIGYVRDKNSGEALIGATVYLSNLHTGCRSNAYGFYSLSVMPGKHTVIFSYVGYQQSVYEIELNNNQILNIDLDTAQVFIKGVIVSTENKNNNVIHNSTGTFKLDSKALNMITLIYGEMDVIKAIQMVPGVTMPSEGSSGLVVRGGNVDQNLILLDEATVYNPSHMMGMFSIFNEDAIKDVKLYKGDIPAAYGGRLSSLLDVRMKEGNNQKFSGNAGIGVISSHLTLECPISKGKSSFIISGRRTYADLLFPLAKDTTLKNTTLYFYDLNMKVNTRINANNRIFLSGYFGNDVYGYTDEQRFSWGNKTGTLRWNHLFSDKIFANMTLLYSHYNYNIQVKDSINQLKWYARLKDYTIKTDFNWYISPEHTIRFGFNETFHIIQPGRFKTTVLTSEYLLPKSYSLEGSAYLSNEQKVSEQLSLEYGARLSIFQNKGKATIYDFNQDYNVIDTIKYSNGKAFKTFLNIEPRFTFTYLIAKNASLKGSYNRTVQYLQQATNSLSGSPLDVWFTSSPNVKPQLCDQLSLGYFRNVHQNAIEVSAEIYYKNIQNQIDFKDNARLLLNDQIEGELRVGKAWSYGVEFMVRKPSGRISGWFSYNWSRTKRRINGINNGCKYNSIYDKPNQVNIVVSYLLTKRITLSANWIYSTGAPATLPSGKYYIGNTALPYYSSRNSSRLPDYHRMDLAFARKGKPHKHYSTEWKLTIYNLYNRRNPFFYSFEQDSNNPNLIHAYQNSLLPIVPTASYNIKF